MFSSLLVLTVFWKALEMSKIEIIEPTSDAMVLMMKIYLMQAIIVYETVKSTLSRIDDPSEHFI